MNYFLSMKECSVEMYLNLLLIKLKVICQAKLFYKFLWFRGDAKNENIIESLGIAKTKTESIDREIW